MLPDVRMVQMYSMSGNVNDLGFAWTGWPPFLHGLALLLVPMVFPPGGLPSTLDTLHHPYICPCFRRKHFYTSLFLNVLWNANCTWATADLLERIPNNSANKGMCPKCTAECVVHCGMWLGGQPRVDCGGWMQDVLLLFG